MKNNKLEQYLEILEDVNTQIDSVREKIAPLQKQFVDLNNSRKEILEKIGEIKTIEILKQGHDEQVSFFVNTSPDSHVMYNAASKFFGEMGIISDGFSPDVKQVAFSLGIEPDESNIDLVFNSLIDLVPFLKPQRNSMICFSLNEFTCAENGSFYLVYNTKSEVWSVFAYSALRFAKSQPDIKKHRARMSSKYLRDVLKYIAKHHPIYNDEND